MAGSLDISKFIASLKEDYQPRASKAAEEAVYRFGNFVLGEAQQLCPVKTGNLKASATAEDAVRDGDDIRMEIGFNTRYAAAVHEILTNHHSQGQAKYLETPMRAQADKLTPYVLEALRKEFD